MARAKAEVLVTQGLIARLTVSEEPWPETRNASITMYRKSLKRDVEWLLNTRQPLMPELDSFPATAASVLNFGLPDIQSFDGSRGKEYNGLLAAIEKCIRVFEPRILQPRVYLERADSLSRSLRFRIEGRLHYEDMDEEVKFDTVLELISGEYEVK